MLIPIALKCNQAVNPLGIDTPEPTLSWALQGPGRSRRQRAYQLMVATTGELLDADRADIWDTGRRISSQSLHIPYDGAKLKSRQRCWWKVRAWDEHEQAGPWSEPSFWEMGLLSEKDWKAQWIASPKEPPTTGMTSPPAPYLRRTMRLTKPLAKARAYVCGLGYNELYVNGRKAGDNVLDPPFTKYDERALYVTHDITALLTPGVNAIGALLGSGWYNCHTKHAWEIECAPWRHIPKLRLQIHLTYTDGTEAVFVSDARWKTADSPIVFDGLFNGEFYDARREIPGWCTAEFDDSHWDPVLLTGAPGGVLTAETLPIKVMKTLAAVGMTEPKPGVFVFDMGQNMTGWARLMVTGAAGYEVTLRYAEMLGADGDIDQSNVSSFVKTGEFQTDRYTLKGIGEEVWEPRFTYHGFRWVQVTGYPGRPTVACLQGRVVHSAFESAGAFACSHDALNRLQQLTRWSYIGNFVGFPTDCPHREKLGWTGDGMQAAETGLFNFAAAPAYAKWMDDFSDVQRASGQLPGIVPSSSWGFNWGSGPAWDSAYIHIPWYLYLYGGDSSTLKRHYPGMKRYLEYMTAMATDHIVTFGLGDWCPPDGPDVRKAPTPLTSTAYYYTNCAIMARVADLLGKKGDARAYRALARKIRKAFNKEFYDAATGTYAGNAQTSMACALYHGLVDETERRKVVQALLASIKRTGGKLEYGILGSKFVPNALVAAGETATAFRMATGVERPSYGYWLAQGATTLWESWGGGGSRNHIMFGDISAWMFKSLAGINPDPDHPGFERIIIRPRPVAGLDWVRAEHTCLYGAIRSAWRKTSGAFTLEITIPPNTTAEVWMPAATIDEIREGALCATDAEGVTPLRAEDKCFVFETGSGSYSFTASYAAP